MEGICANVKFALIAILYCCWVQELQASDPVTCLQCEGATSIKDCNTTVTCKPNEVCFVERLSVLNGTDPNSSAQNPAVIILHNAGCKESGDCTELNCDAGASQTGADGYYGVRTYHHCCSSHVCNAQGFLLIQNDPGNRLCLTCNNAATVEDCTTIKQCGQDQMCSSSLLYPDASMKLECLPQKVCDVVNRPKGKRLHTGDVLTTRCCNGPLCNNKNMYGSSPTVLATSTPIPQRCTEADMISLSTVIPAVTTHSTRSPPRPPTPTPGAKVDRSPVPTPPSPAPLAQITSRPTPPQPVLTASTTPQPTPPPPAPGFSTTLRIAPPTPAPVIQTTPRPTPPTPAPVINATPRPTPPTPAPVIKTTQRPTPPTPVPVINTTPRPTPPTPAPVINTTPGPTSPTQVPLIFTTPRPTPPTPAPVINTTPIPTPPTPAPVINTTPGPTPPTQVPVIITTPRPTPPTPAPVINTTPIPIPPTPDPVINTTPGPTPPTQVPVIITTPRPTLAPVINTTPRPTQAPVINTTPRPTQAPLINTTPRPTLAPVINTTPGPTGVGQSCEDKPGIRCEFMAEINICSVYDLAVTYCKKFCGLCAVNRINN